MNLSTFVAIGLRASALFALALVISSALRRASASLRRFLLLLGFASSLLVPLSALPFPGRPAVHVPAAAVAMRVVAEALSGSSAAMPRRLERVKYEARGLSSVPWQTSWLAQVWALGALIALLRLGLGHLAAVRLAKRAQRAG